MVKTPPSLNSINFSTDINDLRSIYNITNRPKPNYVLNRHISYYKSRSK